MSNKSRNPYVAAIATFFFMGLGHVYVGRLRQGLLFYFINMALYVTMFCSFFVMPIGLPLLIAATIGFVVFAMYSVVKLAKSGDYTPKGYNTWYYYLIFLPSWPSQSCQAGQPFRRILPA